MDARTRQFGLAGFMRQAFLWALLPILALVLISPSVGDAQVVTNITSTTGAGNLGTTITHAGNLYNITDGTRPGNGPNLFHSFGDFSVGGGDIANFLNNTGLPTSNILGRVTGGHVSDIYGTIQTNGTGGFGNANLFLVNPSGIVFGPNGSVNVGGSVSFTTAQYLRLFDGVNSANFYANPANDGLANSVLAVAPVVDFGFLSPAAYGFLTAPDLNATITVQGSALSVPSAPPGSPPNSISLIGGKVIIEGATLPDGTIKPAQLSAPNGTIQLASAASPGEFAAPPGESLANATTLQAVLNNPVPPASAASFTSFGSVTLAPGSSIDVSGARTVFVKGGQLVLSVNDATLSTSDSSALSDTVSLSPDSSIVTSNSGADPGADVQITVGTLNLDGAGTAITTQTFGDGNGGNLTANVGTLSLTNGAAINSNNFSFGLGQGGNVTGQGLQGAGSVADSVTLSNGATITTQTFAPGNAGDVQMTAATIGLDGAGTALTTLTFGDGNGGNLTANVGKFSLTNGAAINSFNFSGGGLAQGGNVTVQGLGGDVSAADSVALSDGASIGTLTFGPGNGGVVQLNATNFMMNNSASIVTATLGGGGVGGDVVLNVGTASLLGGASIQSQNGNFTPGVGQGGNVIFQGLQGVGSAVESVTVSGGSSVSTLTGGSSNGGQVAITSKSLTMDGAGTTINSTANGPGRGGDVVLSIQQASLTGGATITTVTAISDPNAQPGPSLTVQGLTGPASMAGSVVLSGSGSGIISDSSGTASAGDLAVHAKTVTLADGAAIQAGTEATSAAGGNVTIEAGSVDLSGASRISSQASRADAGQISITANTLNLDNGSIATNTVSQGRAGDVVVNTGTLSLSNGATINTTTNSSGRAGDITVNAAGTVTLSGGSKISSASTGMEPTINFDGTTAPPGPAGNIAITATGGFTSNASTIATSAEANHGGDIAITAQNVQLSNGTLINANSKAPLEVTKLVLDQDGQLVPQVVGDGNAGNVTITSVSNFVMQNSSMTTEATKASGGQVVITAPEMVQLINSTISTSVAGSKTDTAGGNITIDPQFVILQNSEILAKAFAGSGGAIDIIAGSAFIADAASIVDASSTLGISGPINIQSPVQNVAGQLTPMPQEFSSAAALLAQQCAARAADGKFSTFVVAGREGLPVEPGGFLASPSLTAELFGSSLSDRPPHTQLSAVTGLFPKYDARPIQLAKFGGACRQ